MKKYYNSYDTEVPYKLILDESCSMEYFINYKKEIQYISPSCKTITGHFAEEFIENPELLIEIVHPQDIKRFKQHFHEINYKKDKEIYEFRINHLDGSTRWISHYCSPLYDNEGNYLGRRGTNIDITRQKEIQFELYSKEKDLEMLFNNSSDGFFYMMIDEPIQWDETVDKDSLLEYVFDHQRITKVNQSMLNQYRAKSKEDFVGLTVRELFSHNIEHGKSVWKEFFDKGVLYVETSEQRLTGEPMYIEGEYLCIYDEMGKITGHFGVQRDVTERKKAAKELKRLNKRLTEEISKAEVIHNRLFPKELPVIPGAEIEAYYQAAIHLGGDLYDFIYYKDKLLIVMADVSGHGLDGAMIATFLKSCIVNWVAKKEEDNNDELNVKEGLEFVARQFQEMGYPDDYFACLFLGLFDPKTKTISYSSTGFHTKIILGKKDSLLEIPLSGLPISGAVPVEILNTSLNQEKLEYGDFVIISTDGLIEAENQRGQYGKRFKKLIKENLSTSAKELKNLIASDFHSFIEKEEIPDDVTFLILKLS